MSIAVERVPAPTPETRELLAEFKVPRAFHILDEIPRGATGKPQRITMAKQLGITE